MRVFCIQPFLAASLLWMVQGTPTPQRQVTQLPEPNVDALKSRYGSQQKQIYLRNGEPQGGEDEMYKIELAMTMARYTFLFKELTSQPGGEGSLRWIGDTTDPNELQEYFKNAENSNVMCYAQPHSAIKGQPFDPMIFCDPKSGYSIHLHTTRDQPLRVRCSAAARIAWEWARANRGEPIDGQPIAIEQVEVFPTYVGREWATMGQSFWGGDPSWIVYIGKEDCTAQDPEKFWPGYMRPPPSQS